MLFFALAVHIGAVLGVLAFRAGAQEVVVMAVQAAHALHVAQNVQVEGQVVPEGAGEADSLFVQERAAVQLVPRGVQKLGVEEHAGVLAEFPLAFENAVGRVAQLAEELALVVVVGVDGEAGYQKVKVVFRGHAVHVFQHGGLAPVVAVHEVQVVAAGNFHGGVARGRCALVFLVDNADAHIVVGQLVAQGAAAVGAAVVYKQDLIAGARLVLQRAHCAAKPRFHVVHGDDDAYRRAV